MDAAFEDGCLLEATLFGITVASDQMKEGTTAFLEKRKTKFQIVITFYLTVWRFLI
jgi:hypothetical protein